MIGGMGASAETPTLYEWACGREAIERLLNRFYDLVEDDELIAPLFGGEVSAEHRDHVATWWCEVLGGPAAYTAWGSRLAMHNSQPGTAVAPHVPVPRWGWGEAPPFEG